MNQAKHESTERGNPLARTPWVLGNLWPALWLLEPVAVPYLSFISGLAFGSLIAPTALLNIHLSSSHSHSLSFTNIFFKLIK